MGFSVSQFWQFFRSVSFFCFGVNCGFSVFQDLVFGSRKNISGFWDLVSDVVFVFSYMGSGFSSMGNYASPLISNCIGLIRVLITGM